MNKFWLLFIVYGLAVITFITWMVINHPILFGCIVVGLFVFLWNEFRHAPVLPANDLNF